MCISYKMGEDWSNLNTKRRSIGSDFGSLKSRFSGANHRGLFAGFSPGAISL